MQEVVNDDIEREDNDRMNGVVIWLTELSGTGKSTITQQLRKELAELGRSPEVLDGDAQRIGCLARLIARQGGVAEEQRDELLQLVRRAPGMDISARNHVEKSLSCHTCGSMTSAQTWPDELDKRETSMGRHAKR